MYGEDVTSDVIKALSCSTTKMPQRGHHKGEFDKDCRNDFSRVKFIITIIYCGLLITLY